MVQIRRINLKEIFSLDKSYCISLLSRMFHAREGEKKNINEHRDDFWQLLMPSLQDRNDFLFNLLFDNMLDTRIVHLFLHQVILRPGRQAN